jgi:hypothetical protein
MNDEPLDTKALLRAADILRDLMNYAKRPDASLGELRALAFKLESLAFKLESPASNER